MGRRREERIRVTPRQRASVVVMRLMLMAPAFAALAQGRLHYQDYCGLLVFAPFSLLTGLVMILFAIRVGRQR
ncbi:MAG: hypothetical protein WB559_09670 [Candidatus Acidiferrales bacterium]